MHEIQSDKKTLVEITSFPPPMGSWSLRIEFLAQAWRNLGHHCILMNIGPSRTLQDPKYLNITGVVDYVFKVIFSAAKGHILHTHTNGKGIKGTLLALLGQCITLPFGRKCVLTFHAGLTQHYFPKTGRFPLDFLMWLTFWTPRLIICNSEKMKDRISVDYNIDPRKIHPIPAFCSEYMKTEVGVLSPMVEKFANTHTPLLVSYVHTFHAEFTVDLMIHTVERLCVKFPTLGLVIMGSTQFSEDYVRLIQERNLVDKILLTGNLPRDEFLAVLARGALYLRTPIGDGVAASVLEALFLGIPVVAVDNGTRPPSCVVYRDGDLEDMINKVEYVIQNRESISSDIHKPEEMDTLESEIKVLASV